MRRVTPPTYRGNITLGFLARPILTINILNIPPDRNDR